ncbi:MAG: ATP synthase F1 subunit epsilon [Alphaproteobacteria bacterium]|nr:MAG: ATP synthase F1 subunit epsilon [Alphaproteobacteria bacterium]
MAQTFHLELVSPAARMFAEQVERVSIPGADGDFSVLAGHCPLVSMIRPGVLDLMLNASKSQRYFIAGGYANVTGDQCSILAEFLCPLEDLQRDAIVEKLQLAKEELAQADDGARQAKAHDVLVLEAKLHAAQL